MFLIWANQVSTMSSGFSDEICGSDKCLWSVWVFGSSDLVNKYFPFWWPTRMLQSQRQSQGQAEEKSHHHQPAGWPPMQLWCGVRQNPTVVEKVIKHSSLFQFRPICEVRLSYCGGWCETVHRSSQPQLSCRNSRCIFSWEILLFIKNFCWYVYF